MKYLVIMLTTNRIDKALEDMSALWVIVIILLAGVGLVALLNLISGSNKNK